MVFESVMSLLLKAVLCMLGAINVFATSCLGGYPPFD